MPRTCVEDLLGRVTPGTLMKCSSRSTEAFITYGVRLIRMATSWIFSSKARDKKAAKKFCRKLLKRLQYVQSLIVTDKLKSYGPVKAAVLPNVEHRQQKHQNNRAENSYQPTRLREHVMRRFRSPGHAQRFLSSFGIISSHFRVGRHLYRACAYRDVMKSRFALWEVAIGSGTDAS